MKKYLYIVFVFFFVSCTQNKNEVKIPEGIIPQAEMVKIIIDYHIAEAALLDCQNKKQDINNYTILYYNSILKKYKISRIKFNTSLKFYSDHIELLQKIYEEAGNELSTMQSKERI